MINKKIDTIKIEETSSTNELAKSFLKKNDKVLPFVVQTNFQTKGKGQYNKSWESNANENLLMSLVLNAPPIDIEKQFDISKAVAVAILKVLSNYTDKKVFIKWPNDIYVGNNKIAGILIENTIIGQRLDSCIIGIGLNVNQIVFSKTLPNPTSLKILTHREHNINLIKDKLIENIFKYLKKTDTIDNLYQQYLYRKGELNQFIDTKDKTFLGVILGVDNWGKLRIRVENNQVKLFTNNEVKMILPQQIN